jgi:hypothetical protein
MLISVFGTPSPLTYWTSHAVRIIAQVLCPGFSFIHAVRLDELMSLWDSLGEAQRHNLVLFSDGPEAVLCDLILSLGGPVVFAADEPEDIVSFLVASRDLSVDQALRLMCQSISTLSVLCGASTVCKVRKERYSNDARDYVEQIVEIFGFIASEEQLGNILSQLITNHQAGSEASLGQQILRDIPQSRLPGDYQILGGEARELTRRVSEQYGAILRNKPLDRFIWPREIFYDCDRPGQFVSGPQLLVGGSRCLIFGPYFHLPRGVWDVHVEVEVEDNISGNEIHSDVFCAHAVMLAGINAVLPIRGVFAYQMTFEVVEPFLPLEVRIELRQGAIEGTFLLRVVELERMRQLETDRVFSCDSLPAHAKGILELRPPSRLAAMNSIANREDWN